MPWLSSILGLSYFEERLSFEKELILQSLHVNLTLGPFNCFPPGVLEASFVSRAEQRLLQAPFNSVKVTVRLGLHTNIFGPTLGILLVTFCALSHTLAPPIKTRDVQGSQAQCLSLSRRPCVCWMWWASWNFPWIFSSSC